MPSTKVEMLEFILGVAERAGVRTAIGGGVAVASHGYRRDTADVDAFFHDADRPKVVREVRRSTGPRDVLDEVDPSHWILVPEGNSADERVDLMFAVGDPEESAIEMGELRSYHGVTVPVFPADLLVASKFLAGREDPRDALDVVELLRRGAYEVTGVQARLRQMGFPEDAEAFPKLIEYLANVPRRTPRRRKV
jgi:hypothetical protein